MAIYSVQVKSLSRGKGDSATAAAAYRAGLDLDDPSGTRHTYSRKTGVLSVDMLAPADAPAWALDPHQVWAKVEEHEIRKNARVAREALIALPHELTPEQRRDLARDVGQLLVDRYNVAAQVALHAPDKGGDGRNYHAHILLTPRVVGADGFGDSAARVLDEYVAGANELKAIRAAIGERMNKALAAAGVDARVDHRSLHKQKMAAVEKGDFKAAVALDRPATRHEGKEVTQARRRGKRLQKAERNDRVRQAADSRVTAHAERFDALIAQAAAEGRLAHVDEQALHAQALLERRKEGAARLRAAQPSPTDATRHEPIRPIRQRRPRAHTLTRANLDACRVRNPGVGSQRMPALQPLDRVNACLAPRGQRTSEAGGFSRVLRRDEQRRDGSGPSVLQLRIPHVSAAAGAAIQARAQRSAAHKAGSSMPRPAAGAAGHQAKGLAAIERASRKHSQSRKGETMAMEQTAKNLEEMIEQMFKVARRALQSADATPMQRATARTFIERREDMKEKQAEYEVTKVQRQRAKLDRRDAQGLATMTPTPSDWRSRVLRTVGLPTNKDKAAHTAGVKAKNAKLRERELTQVRDRARDERDCAAKDLKKSMQALANQFPRHSFGSTESNVPRPEPQVVILHRPADRPSEAIEAPRKPRGPHP